MKIKVLLVEDEQTLAMIVKDTLDDEGFDVVLAEDGEKGIKLYFETKPDIIVADVMMPHLDGFEMVSRIRQTDKSIPVIFLTARSAIKDVVEGFEIGANDYLKKPFNIQELIVRIKALLGRIEPKSDKKESTIFEIGNYVFNPIAQTLVYADKQEELSHRESEILKRLCQNLNSVVETQNILLELWGNDDFFNTKSLHVFITKLRKKFVRDERIKIINVRGIGYKLIV